MSNTRGSDPPSGAAAWIQGASGAATGFGIAWLLFRIAPWAGMLIAVVVVSGAALPAPILGGRWQAMCRGAAVGATLATLLWMAPDF